MIVSHQHKFLFIHCRKAAGSSVKNALAPHLGNNDIVIGSWNEILNQGIPLNFAARRALKSPRGASFYLAGRAIGKTHLEAINIGIKGYYWKRLSTDPPHPSATETRDFFPIEWSNYTKFAISRNPFEQAASDYLWRVRMGTKNLSFREYLEARLLAKRTLRAKSTFSSSNWEMMAIDGRIAIDKVARFDKLEQDIIEISESLGIPIKSLNSKEKTNPHSNEYANLYGKKEKDLVEKLCKPELEAFDYDFPY